MLALGSRTVFHFFRLLSAALLTAWIAPALAVAQESGQAQGQSSASAQQGTAQNPDNDTNAPATPVGIAWANNYITQIGTSGLLAGSQQGVGWGGFYIPSASVTGMIDRVDATNVGSAADLDATIFKTTVVYDHKLGSSQFAVQYSPSLAIVNGQVTGDFSNQNASLNLLVVGRPRWNLRFSDTFSYDYSQETYGFPYYEVNPTTSGAVTNTFLNGPNSWLSNSGSLSASYLLSKRASIVVTPTFTYSQSGMGKGSSHGSASGGTVNLNYRTSERQSLGVQYTGQLITESFPNQTSATSAAPADVVYHTIAVTAARQLTGTLSVSGSLGGTGSWYSQASQSVQTWSIYGTFSVVKQIRRTSLGLNYSRGQTLSSGLISAGYGDRVDGTLQDQVTRRLSWRAGGGYLKQLTFGGFDGWYASTDVQFLLAPRASIFTFFDFIHNNQSGGGNNLFFGTSNFYSFGLRWQPSKAAGY